MKHRYQVHRLELSWHLYDNKTNQFLDTFVTRKAARLAANILEGLEQLEEREKTYEQQQFSSI